MIVMLKKRSKEIMTDLKRKKVNTNGTQTLLTSNDLTDENWLKNPIKTGPKVKNIKIKENKKLS